MIETIPAMAWTARPDGSNAFVNRRWAEYTGLSAEDTAGSGWTAAVHPEDRQAILGEVARVPCYWRAVRSARRAFVALRMGNIAGSSLVVCLCAMSTERFVRWYGILTDIEDRKRAEEERERLRQLEADLAHINRVSMMGELAASIAHEVNQPLSGIVSNGSACLRWLAGDVPNLDEAREAARASFATGNEPVKSSPGFGH